MHTVWHWQSGGSKVYTCLHKLQELSALSLACIKQVHLGQSALHGFEALGHTSFSLAHA